MDLSVSATGGVDFVGLGYLYGNISCFVAFFPRKGTMGDINAFLWIFWYTLLLFVSERKRFFLIFLCACGMELNLLMFVRALQEGMTQFYLSDLFYSGIADCLYFISETVCLRLDFGKAYMSEVRRYWKIFYLYIVFICFLKEYLPL